MVVDIKGEIVGISSHANGTMVLTLAEHSGMFKTSGKIEMVFDKSAFLDLCKHLNKSPIEAADPVLLGHKRVDIIINI